jgi:hypothetical protein
VKDILKKLKEGRNSGETGNLTDADVLRAGKAGVKQGATLGLADETGKLTDADVDRFKKIKSALNKGK